MIEATPTDRQKLAKLSQLIASNPLANDTKTLNKRHAEKDKIVAPIV